MENMIVKAKNLVEELKKKISTKDLRSIVTYLGGGEYDKQLESLLYNPNLPGKREKEINNILVKLEDNDRKQIKELVGIIDNSGGKMLNDIIPL